MRDVYHWWPYTIQPWRVRPFIDRDVRILLDECKGGQEFSGIHANLLEMRGQDYQQLRM